MDFSWRMFNDSREPQELVNFQQIFAPKGFPLLQILNLKKCYQTLILDPIRWVYESVDFCLLLLGLPLNVFLIYLIKTKTKPDMQRYSQLLIISCILDLFAAVWTSIVQPVSFLFISKYFIVRLLCENIK